MIRHAALTDEGKRRDHNEDAYLTYPEYGLFVVADGVGGWGELDVCSGIFSRHLTSTVKKLYTQ